MTKREVCNECNGTGERTFTNRGGEKDVKECNWCFGSGRVEIDDDAPMADAEEKPELLVLVIFKEGTTAYRNVTFWSIGEGFLHLSNLDQTWHGVLPMDNIKSIEITPESDDGE
jgi:hypothetical protein